MCVGQAYPQRASPRAPAAWRQAARPLPRAKRMTFSRWETVIPSAVPAFQRGRPQRPSMAVAEDAAGSPSRKQDQVHRVQVQFLLRDDRALNEQLLAVNKRVRMRSLGSCRALGERRERPRSDEVVQVPSTSIGWVGGLLGLWPATGSWQLVPGCVPEPLSPNKGASGKTRHPSPTWLPAESCSRQQGRVPGVPPTWPKVSSRPRCQKYLSASSGFPNYPAHRACAEVASTQDHLWHNTPERDCTGSRGAGHSPPSIS